ncbi:C-type lectin domain family 4 member K-like [Latimeria chalumnae]|uniref:C-type lectin domain family 4 member K-like n=1 Tax=Latimeria chalumnae TaxID=7897 RepID=UPI00313D47A5
METIDTTSPSTSVSTTSMETIDTTSPSSSVSTFPTDINQREYFPVKELRTWNDALDYCRTKKTDLASIRSQEEQEKVEKLVKNSSDGDGVWIGLRKDRLFGFWFWMNDDESEYSNRGNGAKGDPLSDHCGRIDKENFTWSFKCCFSKLNFICY